MFKPAAEPEQPKETTTGSEVLRLRLKRLASSAGASIANVARDVNEALIEAATREHALSLAKRMAGEDASEEVLRDIAKSMMGSLSGGTPPGRTLQVGESQLREYMDRKLDLDPAIKTEIGRYFFDRNVFYDAERDLMAYPPAPPSSKSLPTITPERWTHPDLEVRSTHAAYQEALVRYNARNGIGSSSAPQPLTPPEQKRPSWPRRAGFAERV
jgi:hypothetical protein